jgi:hypothetical protein
MFQQVNLYQPIFREEQKLFSATTIGLGLAALSVGLLAFAGFAAWRVALLERQLHTVRTQADLRQRLAAESQGLYASGRSAEDLRAHVEALALELARRQQALRYLASGAAGVRGGFAARVEALAREQLDGLWLTGATFTAESGRFALAGSASSPERVPEYLARLANEPALAGAKLESLEIRRPKEENAAHIDFVLSSSAPPPSTDTRLAMAGARGSTP